MRCWLPCQIRYQTLSVGLFVTMSTCLSLARSLWNLGIHLQVGHTHTHAAAHARSGPRTVAVPPLVACSAVIDTVSSSGGMFMVAPAWLIDCCCAVVMLTGGSARRAASDSTMVGRSSASHGGQGSLSVILQKPLLGFFALETAPERSVAPLARRAAASVTCAVEIADLSPRLRAAVATHRRGRLHRSAAAAAAANGGAAPRLRRSTAAAAAERRNAGRCCGAAPRPPRLRR